MTLDIPASTNAAGAKTLAISGVQLDLRGATQYGSAFGVTNLAQDGYAAGQLSGVAIESSGVVMATYSNGQSQAGRPGRARDLPQPAGPEAAGRQQLGQHAGVGRRRSSARRAAATSACCSPGALEESNVDLTSELVNMITAQRIYQANAQTIKTEDQVLQTLVNLR